MPSGAISGSESGFGDDLPPFDRSLSGGRHRGPRRPAFRAAVPIAAVLAAGGGALGLVHATGSGTTGSQDLASGSSGSSVTTTDLSNAPSAFDASSTSGTGPGADTMSSALAANSPDSGARSADSTAAAPTTAPDGHQSSPAVSAKGSSSAPANVAPGTTGTTANPVGNTPAPPSNSSQTNAPSNPAATTPGTPGTPSSTGSDGSTTPSDSATPPTPPSGSGSTAPTPDPTPTGPTSPSNPAPSGPSAQASPFSRVLQPGDTGQDVANLQTLLDRLGTPTWVPVTGVYDSRTTDAVAYVQNMLNISADPRGVCGSTTAIDINTLASH